MDYINFPQRTAYQGVPHNENNDAYGHEGYQNQSTISGYEQPSPLEQGYQNDPSKTAYYGVSAVEATSPNAGFTYERKDSRFSTQSLARRFTWNRENRAWWKTILIQLFAAAWLIPIAVLLYLNITGYVIGASAWCPGGNCRPDIFGVDRKIGGYVSKTAKFDKQSHNLLGALQFVAKALEVWFALIATSLVYLITMHLAGQPEGLPIGYIFRPNEFSEVVGLLDPLLYTSLRTAKGKTPLKPRVYAFIGFTVFLCVLINLMGPAVAVLVLPTLDWIDAKKVSPLVFGAWGASSPPQVGNAAYNVADNLNPGVCTPDYWDNGWYSCAGYPYGVALDALMAGWSSTQNAEIVTSQAGDVVFTFNQTFEISDEGYVQNYLTWVPSRQVLEVLSSDYENIYNISTGVPADQMLYPALYDTYTEYNKSLELEVQREAPVLGATTNMHISYNSTLDWTIKIENDKSLKCFAWYDTSSIPYARQYTIGKNYTKCVTHGGGWGNGNIVEKFSIASFDGAPGVDVEVFSSTKAAFLPNGTVPSGLSPSCIYGGGATFNNQSCNWDALFVENTDPNIALRTGNTTTIQYTMASKDSTVKFTVDFTAVGNFTTYTYDPYPDSNPISLARTPDLPRAGTPLLVDPNWMLVAFGVNRGGELFVNRTSPALLTRTMSIILDTDSPAITDYASDGLLDIVALMPIVEAMSIVDYSSYAPGDLEVTEEHPLMSRWAKMYVWTYGTTSRTSYLGIAVAVLGCLVVLVQIVFGILSKREYRSSTQLLVAALEHSPQGEFHETDADEKEVARVRFHIRERRMASDEGGIKRAGTFDFEKKNH